MTWIILSKDRSDGGPLTQRLEHWFGRGWRCRRGKMSRRSVVKSLDSGRLEKNHRIVTTFWALKCPMPRPLFGGVSWYQGKPWLGDRSEDAVLWWDATPSYGMSIKEKRWNNIINHEIKAVWLAFMLLFLQYCPLQARTVPKCSR